MFDLKQQDTLLFITLSGKITADEVTRFYEQFDTLLEDKAQAGIVIDMTGFDDITGDAIARDIPLELGMLDKMGKFPKIAILSDKEFVAATVSAVNPLVPMIDMRVFGAGEEQAARDFAADLPPAKPAGKGKGLYLLEDSSDQVLAFAVDGYMDDDEMEVISKEVLRRIETGGEFRALARIKSFGGFDPEILTEGSFFKMKFGAVKEMKKYAIVTDEKWLKPLISFGGMVSGIDMKLFALADEQAAWDWVRA